MRKPSKRQQEAELRKRKTEVLLTMDGRVILAESDNALLAELFGGDGVADALRIMLDAPRRYIALQIDKLTGGK